MSVAQILEKLAENAGRRALTRGQILGESIAGAAAIPAQVIEDRRKQALVDAEQRRADEGLALRRNQDTREQGVYAQGQTKYLQDQAKEKTLRGIIAAGFADDPNVFNDKAAIAAAQQSDYPELVTTVQDIHAKLIKPVVPPLKVGKDEQLVSQTDIDPATGKLRVVAEGVRGGMTTPEIQSKAIAILAIPEALRTSEQRSWLSGYQQNNPEKFGMTPAAASAANARDRSYGMDVRRYNFAVDPLGMYGTQTPIPVPGTRGAAPSMLGQPPAAAPPTAPPSTGAPPTAAAPTGAPPTAAKPSAFQGVAAANVIDSLKGLSGQAFMDKLSESRPDLAAEVKSYAEGRRPFPTGVAGYRLEPLIRLVSQYDPTFDATDFNGRNKARADLMSQNGIGGKTINALNTAIQHAGVLSELIEKQGNTNYPIANWAVNAVGKQFGKTGTTNFEAVQPQLMKEVERLWRGAGGSQGDIDALKASLGPNMGHQQQVEALGNFVQLMEGKLRTTEEQRDKSLGPFGRDIPVLYDRNKPILDTILKRAGMAPTTDGAAAGGGAPTMIEAKDAQGNIHHAPAGTPLPTGWTLVK